MTEEPIVLLHRDWTSEAVRGLWSVLSGWEAQGAWDLIHLRVMRPASAPDLKLLWRQMPNTWPFVLTRSNRKAGQTRRLPATWPVFRQSLGKSMRDEVAEAVPALIRLHGLRAHSERGPAHLNHLPGATQKDFMCAVLTRLADVGQAALALLEVDGQEVAVQAVLEGAGRLTFYDSGFDPRWHRYSPVTVLPIMLIRRDCPRTKQPGLSAGRRAVEDARGTEAEWVFDELSCLSVHPKALFRSAWRKVIYHSSRRRGSLCERGLCLTLEQEDKAWTRSNEQKTIPAR